MTKRENILETSKPEVLGYGGSAGISIVKDYGDRYRHPAPSIPPHRNPQGVVPQATRHNAGKVELSYLFDCPLANAAKCQASVFGAAKYNRDNWRKGLPVSNLVDSALRHLQSYMNGETLDSESGIHHLGHVLWNIEKALEFSLTKPELDDRFKHTTTNEVTPNETI